MKRIIAFILAALFVFAMCAACEKSKDKDEDEDDVVGKYVVYMVDGEIVDKEDVDDYLMIELKSNGKYEFGFPGGADKDKGEWKKEGNKIILDDEGDDWVFTYKGGKLYGEYDHGEEVVYKKK